LVLVDDDAAHVLVAELVVGVLVDLVEGVRPGDDLVELDVARLVEAEDSRDVGSPVPRRQEQLVTTSHVTAGKYPPL
jgi:hypothetical protein